MVEDYFILVIGATNNICRILIKAKSFKLKLVLISMINNVHINTIRLGLFPFLLTDSVLKGLTTLPDRAITTCDECTHKFLLKYFPPSKSNKLKNIINFSQFEQEPLDKA
ncbi:hypothetical protein CR513_49831, partial [Mucuna pruriens]